MSDRNTSLAAPVHWALLPSLGALYHAEAFGYRAALRWRVAYRLMQLVERLPSSALYKPLPRIACNCDFCRGVPGAVFEP